VIILNRCRSHVLTHIKNLDVEVDLVGFEISEIARQPVLSDRALVYITMCSVSVVVYIRSIYFHPCGLLISSLLLSNLLSNICTQTRVALAPFIQMQLSSNKQWDMCFRVVIPIFLCYRNSNRAFSCKIMIHQLASRSRRILSYPFCIRLMNSNHRVVPTFIPPITRIKTFAANASSKHLQLFSGLLITWHS
jgi:hypothetical protein